MKHIIPSHRIQRLHMVGIGGAGMSGIAEVLHENGFLISGSDLGSGPVIQYLRSLGIRVDSVHDAKNVEDADLVIYSSAIQMDNPEIVEAKAKRIPVIRRAEMLGELMRLKYTLAISGTHGKTTTTSMVGAIWESADEDPTVIVGGIVKGKGSGAKVGRGRYLVAESDEFDRSFLWMMPSSAVITNIDVDHLDTYGSLEEIKNAFIEFSNKVPFYGQVVVCIDDLNVQSILSRLRKPIITYGFSRQAMYRIENFRVSVESGSVFEIFKEEKFVGEFTLRIPGKHNVLNAAASIALATEENIPVSVIQKALAGFSGVKRRLELIGNVREVFIYDDYAHHPTEVSATLQGIRDTFPEKRVIVVFQPHLFSRTRDQYEAFGAAFLDCDIFLGCDIYPAREEPISGITGELIVKNTQERGHRDARFIGDKQNALPILKDELKEGDVVILMGAGNISGLGKPLMEILE